MLKCCSLNCVLGYICDNINLLNRDTLEWFLRDHSYFIKTIKDSSQHVYQHDEYSDTAIALSLYNERLHFTFCDNRLSFMLDIDHLIPLNVSRGYKRICCEEHKRELLMFDYKKVWEHTKL